VRELNLRAMPDPEKQAKSIECRTHGTAFEAFICIHLAADPRQAWYSSMPKEHNPWPDSWCSVCHETFQQQGDWNEGDVSAQAIRLLCHHCYELRRAEGTHIEVPD
jgi:hypothetical protein